MSDVVALIEDKIIDLMIADSNFDSVFFIQGVALNVPAQFYPNCEVHILTARTVESYTGNWYQKSYTGEARFYGRYQDKLAFSSRRAIVPSAAEVSSLVRYFTALFETTANKNLQGLTAADFAVTNIMLTDLTYGWEQRDQRTNNWDNFGAVRFEVLTTEMGA